MSTTEALGGCVGLGVRSFRVGSIIEALEEWVRVRVRDMDGDSDKDGVRDRSV